MFEREKALNKRSGWWREIGYWRWLGLFALLLGLSALAGCGTDATTATTTLSHPQPTATIGPFHTTVQTFDKDFTITLDITPNRSGPNHFLAQIMDNHTHTFAVHVAITLYTTMQDMSMGTDSVALHGEGGGQYSATSNVLSMGGHWALGITIRTSDHVIHKAGVSFVLPL
jgi:copper transport protein